jgi:hypothetical protein
VTSPSKFRPFFPATVDSTLLAAFRACPQKFYLSYVQHWKPVAKSVHLVAGGAFASAIEAAREAYYVEGKSDSDAEAIGMSALIKSYGDFECPPDSAKSLERMLGAFEFYLFNYPLGGDGAEPITLPSGRKGIEFSFAEPLAVNHPGTGQPILYTGRSDMVANRHGTGIWNYDEKTTSALGATWSRQWEMRCFAPGHELLTREGWVRIEDLSDGVEVMQVSAEGNMDFVLPTAYHSYEMDGELVSIEGRRLSQLVTKNHRILLNKRRGGVMTVLAEDLHLQDVHHYVPLAGNHHEQRLPDILQRFLAAVQADATLRPSRGVQTEGRGHREHSPYPAVAFKFNKPRKIERLLDILKELKADYTGNLEKGEIYLSGFSILAELVATYLTDSKQFIPGHESMYGDAFLNELRHWDGWESQYYTKHKNNAEFVATVAALNGRSASVTYNTRDNYTVVLSDDVNRTLKSVKLENVSYKGPVYCVTVPEGYVLTRLNGNISVSGNSQFTGYNWALLQQGIKPQGTIVRGVSILKTKYDTLEVPTYRSQHEIDLWEKQTLRDIRRMIQCWEEGYWDYDLDGACTEYGGCQFQRICKSSTPEEWLPAHFVQRVWDPLERTEISVADYESKWGFQRPAFAPPAPGLPGVLSGDGQALGDELRGMM